MLLLGQLLELHPKMLLSLLVETILEGMAYLVAVLVALHWAQVVMVEQAVAMLAGAEVELAELAELPMVQVVHQAEVELAELAELHRLLIQVVVVGLEVLLPHQMLVVSARLAVVGQLAQRLLIH
jgi:hypothetical protein